MQPQKINADLQNIVEYPEVAADRIELEATVLGDPSRMPAANDRGFDTSTGQDRVAPDAA